MNNETVAPNTMSVTGSLDLTIPETDLRFADGRIVRVPTALLQQEQALALPQPSSLLSEDTLSIPLIEEQLEVGKRTVETGKVYLQKSSEAYDVAIDESLAVNTWKVKRIPKHEVVLATPTSRQEGNTTIYPLVEERLILTKEIVLIEEIHVTRELSERRDTQTVTLHRETLSVERGPTEQA